MGALFSAPGVAWPWLGLICAGLAASLVLARRASLPAWWLFLAAPALGVPLFGLLAILGFAIVPPGVAPAVAALPAAAALVWVLRSRRHRSAGVTSAASRRLSTASERSGWTALAALYVAAGAIGLGAARYARAVLYAAPLDPLLGEPSTGDWGLHALRVAMIARHGVPPPSPLDPDYPLAYRYMFHALAASFAAVTDADVAAVSAALSGLVVAALVTAGGALGWLGARSLGAAGASGLLAALYGPTYWLPDAVQLLAGGQLPTWGAVGQVMHGKWTLSPFAPSFPSMLSAQGGSPGLPLAALCWIVVLLCAGCLVRTCGAAGSLAAPAAVVGGMALVSLAFAADFFVPVAAAGLIVFWVAAHRDLPRRVVGIGAGVAVVALAVVLAATRQVGAAGAAQNVRLAFNPAAWVTPVYGGNHALLAGGTPLPLPNWVQLHDWGLLFWPGALGALGLGVVRRRAILTAGAATALLAAIFWQVFDVTYETGTPTSARVQMYRYASLATTCLAPLLPALVALVSTRWPALLRAVLQIGLIAVAGGAGLYLAAGGLRTRAQTPAAWAGDMAMARALAAEPGDDKRLVVLNAPARFLGMYDPAPGGYVALWWALGETPVPVGWDFGHPEYYEPLYRRVAENLDPGAAAELRVTHVAFAPVHLSSDQRWAIDPFLQRCRAERVAAWGADSSLTGRLLYRIQPDACSGS